MSELDKLLEGLTHGGDMPDALRDVVKHTLDEDPRRAVEIRARLLDARRDELLSDRDLAKLLTMIATLADSDATQLAFDDDATQINAVDDASDATQLNTAAADGAKTSLGIDSADTTELNTRAAGEADDATQLNPIADGHNSDDATIINAEAALDDDRTQILSDSGPDQTGVPADGGEEFDILSDNALAAVEGAKTGASWPTTLQESPGAAGTIRELSEGDVLKDRFELISKLGEGGMGAVWKAKDRLKEEARDRNPFVAVKLLQGDFKDHPEAFIALQREASKQQRLAHPNIATVYDFDRDGETVYMTMEAMDGEPMDSFIRKLPAEGLPEEEAMVLIRDLCEGLAYAHRAGLVHSDLKPGNAFLVKDPERELGRIKLLDFGIARASSTKADADGEKTLFDPGELGALTPTYATIEMFDGQDPDPRDDIYALAIIAYQLYTGKHPYGKKSAPKAKELALVPPPIERLDKRQNRGFVRGLAFEREARTPSVEEFLDDITRKKSRALTYSIAAALVLLVIGVLAWGPVKQEMQSREREEYVARIEGSEVTQLRAGLSTVLSVEDEEQRSQILADERVRERVITLISKGDEPSIRDGLELIREPGFEALKESIKDDPRTAKLIGAFIARGDEQSIRTGLELIKPFERNWQRLVKDQPPVKNAIISFYTRSMYEGIDPQQGKYGYAQAAAPLAVLEEIYPDSAEVFQVRRELDSHKNTELDRLSTRFDELLKAGKVLPDPNADDIGDLLAIIAGIDAAHPVLGDAQIATRFVELASEAMRTKDFDKASELLLAGAKHAASDPRLLQLREEVDAQLKRIANEQRVAFITKQLSSQWRSFKNITNFEATRDELAELARLDPQSQLLADMSKRLQQILDDELGRLRSTQDWLRSETLFSSFAQFLPVPFVTDTRARLSLDEREAGFERNITAQDRDAIVAARTATLESLLADPKLTPLWALEVKGPLNDLIALLPVGDAALATLRDQLARLYLSGAQQARKEQRFDGARSLLAAGKLIDPQLSALTAEEEAITDDEKALQARRQEEKRLARISTLKASMLEHANAEQAAKAQELLEQLGKELPPDDEFMTRTGPAAIGKAYLRQAKTLAQGNDFDAAAALVETGLQIAPFLEPLQSSQHEYRERRIELAESAQIEVTSQAEPMAAGGTNPTAPIIDIPRTAMSAGDSFVQDQGGGSSHYAAAAPVQLATLLPRVDPSRAQVLARYPSLGDAVAKTSAQRIESLAQSVSLDLNALEPPLAGYAVLYPEHAPALNADVVRHIENRLRELVQQTPLDVLGLRVPLEAHGRLFADRHPTLVPELVADVEGRIIAYTDTQPLDVNVLSEPIRQFASVFPAQAKQLNSKIDERLQNKINALAQASTTEFKALEAPMRAYRDLYPQRHAELADKVGRTIGARLSALQVDTPARLTALVDPLARFKAMFADAYSRLSTELSDKAAAAIQSLVPKDIYAADKLRRAALKALPGSTAIAAIRIELPLQEIIDANKLMASGKLNAAMKKLEEAISVDAQHSDIPPFQKALQDRSARAQADYDLYVRYTAERKDRDQRKKLFASATKAWADNPGFVSVKEPRSGSCLASLAGRGRSKRSICYDLVAKNRKGPLLVVLPAGKSNKPFAIGKYEITVDQFNQFCKANKSCKTGKSSTRKLPVTRVSLEQAQAYAQWLSQRASETEGNSVVYRLPTNEEWAYAATANGEQPETRSFNCRVTSSGNIIKGHALLDASTGKENGWGLVNYVGNARELATTASGALALGGAFEDSLTSCGVDKAHPHSGAPDALTGFRLVREISG